MQTFNRAVQVAFVLLLCLFSACQKEDLKPQEDMLSKANAKKDGVGFQENDLVMYWNDKTRIVLSGNFTPQAVGRYYAMVQIAVHDALNSIKPKYETYALRNMRVKDASPDAAVASAAYNTIIRLGFTVPGTVLTWYNESLAGIPDGEAKQKGIDLGLAAANAIIARRTTDNFATANMQRAGLPDGTTPGAYRSTIPFNNPMSPRYLLKALDRWNTLTPFVLTSGSQFRADPPYPVNSPEYTADYNEVKTKGGLVGSTRTAEESEIGKFWVENSSFGWNRLARTLIEQRKIDSWRTARLFALMHTAMVDASITNFDSKYFYFYWRPETAIRLLTDDGNPDTEPDPTWLPFNMQSPAQGFYTPPIPDYPSQHANYGGAAGEVIKMFFETDRVSVDLTSASLPNVSRRYTSISQAMRDNSLSRIYVGYHFRKAAIAGEVQGIQVGRFVFENAFRESPE